MARDNEELTFDDVTNEHIVGSTIFGDGSISIIRPPAGPITRKQALVFAAWIVTLAERNPGEFKRALEAVQST